MKEIAQVFIYASLVFTFQIITLATGKVARAVVVGLLTFVLES